MLWRTRIVNSSEIKPEMAVDSRSTMKNLTSLEIHLHLKRLCLPPPKEQTTPGELITDAFLLVVG